MTVTLKDNSVRIANLQPGMIIGHTIVASIFREHGFNCVITSGCEHRALHSITSLHYAGAALDYRCRHIPTGQLPELIEDIRKALGGEFDVVPETDHLHVELQPHREFLR